MNFSRFFNKILIPIMILSIIVAFNEQGKTDKNIYLMILAFAIFIFGMIRLSAKTPSKNPQNEDDNV
jgi:predicted permease